MDIEQIVGNVNKLMAFKADIEGMIAKAEASGAPRISADDVEKVVSFLPEFDRALTDFGKLASDIKSVSEHVAEIRQDLAPVIEWVEAKQRDEANAAAKAEADEAAKAEAAAKAVTDSAPKEVQADEPVDGDKPLAHLVEAEQKLEGADTASA